MAWLSSKLQFIAQHVLEITLLYTLGPYVELYISIPV